MGNACCKDAAVLETIWFVGEERIENNLVCWWGKDLRKKDSKDFVIKFVI